MSDVQKNTETAATHRPVRPLTTICERSGEIILTLEMPGVSKNNVDIRIENDELKITGDRDTPDVDGTIRVRERPRGDYHHSFTIDETIERDSISAVMENGVLTVTLQLNEAVKPRKIEVRTAE